MIMTENTMVAIASVIKERQRQQEKWGDQNHELPVWNVILSEEFGELAEAIYETILGKPDSTKGGFNNMRDEAVQVAAVALQIVEYLDREKDAGRL